MQRSPITRRTCKHLIQIRGAAAEQERAPDSFLGRTRGKRTEPRSEPLAFMSYHTWNPQQVPPSQLEGWFYSIKLDGAFARWDHGRLLTKSGRVLHPPSRITAALPPDVALDGEIYHPERQKVRKAVLADEWDDDVEFIVFDLFDTTLPFADRWQQVETWHRTHPFLRVKQYRFSADEWPALATQIETQKEEGLVLRDPAGRYTTRGRSRTTLKWKPLSHGQARIEALEPKKVGLRLTLRELHHPDSSVTFRVYSQQAPNRFRLGDVVPFVYTGRDERNRPEFPRVITPAAT